MRLSLVSGLPLLGAAHAAVSTISAYGNKFFYENGTREQSLSVLTPGGQSD